MQPLSAVMVLDVWERGAGSASPEKALLVLDRCCPERDRESLLDLSVGRRDRLLLEVYRATFGDDLDAFTGCPQCHERLEFSLSCGALLKDTLRLEATPAAIVTMVTSDGTPVSLRAPNSRDLALAAADESIAAARTTLLSRCTTLQSSNDAIEGLSESAQAEIAERIATLDPQAELLANLVCPVCGNAWRGVFEVVQFLWAGIAARARRLLQEVDTLARVYGWREPDILALSDMRRGLYMQMALS